MTDDDGRGSQETEAVGDQGPGELSAALRELHLQAGEPSTREIGSAVHFSHTTVAQILKGNCARWPTLLRVISHLDGDPVEFKRLWVASRSHGDPGAEFLDVSEAASDGQPQTNAPDEAERPRATVLRLTRTTARDGTRSEALEIFDPQLAQAIIKSYLHDGGDASEEV